MESCSIVDKRVQVLQSAVPCNLKNIYNFLFVLSWWGEREQVCAYGVGGYAQAIMIITVTRKVRFFDTRKCND